MPNPLVTEAIRRLLSKQSLSAESASGVLEAIMSGEVSEPQVAGFLVALKAKGESVDEIVGLARTMREFSTKVDVGTDELVDTAGTGGGANTFNVSTTAALIACGAGAKVAKHGNRSATSRCGSADVLEALGVRIDLEPDAVADCLQEVGFCFMFAPSHHQAMKYVVPVRKELAVSTIFNFLGPLTNPAGAAYQLIGVSDPNYTEVIARSLAELETRRALVVTSDDGLDELSINAPSTVFEVSESGVNGYTIDPQELGITAATGSELTGGDPSDNATMVHKTLAGEASARADLALLNAAAALYIFGKADTVVDGIELAKESISSGKAAGILDALIQKTRELAQKS